MPTIIFSEDADELFAYMEMETETEMGGHHGGGDNDRNLILISTWNEARS